MDSENKLKFFINQFEEGGEHQELSNNDWTVSSFLEWLEANNFEIHKKAKSVFPNDAHSFEVFAIKDCKESPTGKEAYIGCKLANGNFHFISVPFTEPYES
jgi:hypothetical protein